MSDRPVVVTLPNGAEYGVKDAATAKRLYPDGTVTRFQDGEPITQPKDTKAAKADKDAKA